MAIKFNIEVTASPKNPEPLRVLSRSVQWTPEEVVYESDNRHAADRPAKELGLKSKNVVVTPAVRESNMQDTRRTRGFNRPTPA